MIAFEFSAGGSFVVLTFISYYNAAIEDRFVLL